uniref:DUF6598 domain-containing protein n=1 Tax=Leersia perrieri TaxID=77586 RepID=A0A0D9XTU2_9ORYZ
MDPAAAAAGGGEEEKGKVVVAATTTCFADFISKSNIDGDDGGGDAGRDYRRAEREEELKRRWIFSVLAMAGREVDAGVVDPDNKYYYKSSYVFKESSRDLRHIGNLPWHEFYSMHVTSPTALGPMDHWTHCSHKGHGCKNDPDTMLQTFDIKILPFTLDVTRPVEVYGIIAVRDDVDEYRRNYLFNRSRDNPVTITPAYDSLPLMSPARGMSVAEACLIETDIRIKLHEEDDDDDTRDLTIADACMDIEDHRCGLDCHAKDRIDGEFGTVLTHSMVIQSAVEATIQLDFKHLPSPPGDFRLRMTGYTARGLRRASTYVFAGEGREFDGIVLAAGKLEQRFVAAVKMGDTLELSFMEEGRQPMAFMSAKHDSEVKPYRFENGALVLVQVSWSVMELGP